ncbi:hypothetical protein LTR82_000459 [Friedmanniomyces endolithicus]|uniref:Uncharacterized protein n=1 Tax=Friedmanniomyces endolithicus TaxID=329885 RepID=A0AAN6G2C4_9PEZI|nr:hypothetical protein LTR82_000459 [Friedmanniomyces endolithicus]
MADDLLKLLEDVEKKDEELKEMAGKVWTRKDEAQKMSGDEATEMHRSAQVGGGDGIYSMPSEASSKEKVGFTGASDARLRSYIATQAFTVPVSQVGKQIWMQDAHHPYQIQLAQVEESWRSQMDAEHKLRQATEDRLYNMKQSCEARMKEVESQARIRIAEQQRRLQETEVAVKGRSPQAGINSGWTDGLDLMHQLVADQEVEINNEYQRAEQFRRMSERLTTQVKHSNMANQAQQFRRMSERSMTQAKPANMADQALEQAEQAEKVGQQRLKNVKSQSTKSRHQRRKKQTPGSF